MGKGSIVSKGVGADFYAAINARYPIDAVCTCTDGKRVLKARGKNGQWFFPIPYNGEWTVAVGEKTQKVSITEAGQLEEVNLDELVLFDNGANVEWTSLSRISGNDSVSIGSTIVCRRNSGVGLSYTGAVAYTYEAISLKGYKTLNVRFKSATGLSSYIGLVAPSVSDKDDPSKWAASRECSSSAYGSGGTATLDISGCSGQTLAVVIGEGYVKNETGSSSEVDKVWLT